MQTTMGYTQVLISLKLQKVDLSGFAGKLLKCKTINCKSEAIEFLSCMLTLEFMSFLQFWTKVVDSENRLSEYLQNSSIGYT